MLEAAARKAQESGEIDPAADPAQIAYELNALVSGANRSAQLLGDAAAWRRARAATTRHIDALSAR